MTYSEKLKDPRWQKKRLEVLNRDKWTCQLCGDDKATLHVHHKSYSGEPWNAETSELITYCYCCHLIVEHLNEIGVPSITKVFKDGSDNLCLLYAIGLGKKSGLPAIYTFEYYKDQNQFLYTVGMSFKTYEKVSKEIKRLFRKK